MKLYSHWEMRLEKCNFGCEHTVAVLFVKNVEKTDETWDMDNGYEVVKMPVYRDRQGNKYYAIQSFDYYAKRKYIKTNPAGVREVWWHNVKDAASADRYIDPFGNEVK